jgi:PAS domain S-box-containing protein
MFGYASIAELEEIDVADLYADAEERKAFSDNLLAQGNVKNVEIHFRKNDGTLIWGSITASVVHDPDTGEAAYFDCVVEDITERLRVEEEIFRQAEELATLHAISLDITAALALPTLLQTIVKRAARLLKARGGSLSLCDPEHQEARVYAEHYPGLPDQTGRVFKYGDGAVGIVAQTGKPLIIDDYRKWPQRVTFHDNEQPYTAVLCVPLTWEGQVTGVLQVMDDVDIKRFTNSDLELLTLFANQAAIAVQNARLLEAERSRLQEAETLRGATAALTSTLDPDQVLNAILVQLEKVVPYDCASVFLQEEDSLRIVAARGFPDPDKVIGSEFLADELLNAAKQAGQAIILDDAQNDPRFSNWAGTNFVHGWLGVPLNVRGDTIGYLTLDNREVGIYDHSHASLAESFANQAAIALVNARLFEAERTAREQAETLREVAQAVSGTLELNEVLRLILEQLKRVLMFNTSSVLIYQEAGGAALVAGIGYQDDQLTSRKAGDTLMESPILKQMSQTLEPIVISDVRQHPDWIWADGAKHVRSFLAVPIISLGKMIGALMVDSELPDFYHPKDVQTAQSLAQHMAIAIQNARLFAAERASRERSDALREASRIISASLSLEQVIDAVLEQLARVMEYDSGNVMLLKGDYLYLEAGRGYEAFTDPSLLDEVVIDIKSHHSIRSTLESGQPIMVADTRVDPDWQETMMSDHIRSWLAVPLRVRDKSIGLFNLDRVTPGGFSPEEIALAQAFAVNTSAAIENARSFESEEKRVAELEALRQASLSLTASLNRRAVLDAILKSALQLLPGAQNAHIFLYHPGDGGRLKFGAVLWPDGLRDEPISEPRQNGLTYTVARSGEAILVPDMADHPLFENVPADWKGSIFGLPLKIGESVVGVMNVSHTKAGAFSEDELTVLRLLGDQAAIAIENARLFEQAATERRHLSLLYDVGRGLAASLDTGEILNRATTLTCQALGGLLGEAFLYLPREELLSLRAVYGREETEHQLVKDRLQFNMGVGLAGWVAQNRRSINVPDVTSDTRWLHVAGIDEDVRSALCAPILQGDRLFGVLAVLHHQPSAFSEDHLDLLQAICHQVGLALSNAERYQQVQSLVDLLEVEQQRLDDLVERLPVGVLLLDEDHKLLVANSLGSDILSLLGAGEVGEVLTYLGPYELKDLIAQHADPLPVDLNLEGPPQRMFEAQVRSLGTEQSQWVITVREVTEEREIQARIQMQDRLATVGQLASGIAHDFNNIMAAIMVYTDLLQKDLALFPTGSERLAIIQQQVQRATSLIRQILDFSRRSVMEQSNLDLLPFIKELEKLLARLLPEVIHLELSYQPEEYWVKADPTRLQQVFMNLAVNARDAMPEGGTLFFELDRMHLQSGERPPFPSMRPGEWIRIAVKDTGEGIPPDKLPHIFEPFFTTKPVGEGTGLGLAQAYGIVKQHDGFIDVQSQLGVGTKFTIYLPALSVTEKETIPQKDLAGIEGEGETILVVEDDWVTLAALRDLLETQNYNVLMSQNGIEALEIFEQSSDSIDLVVCDVVMPEMGGVALYNALREQYPHVKMLFITGHPLQEENQALLEKGSVHWMQKPFSVPDFSQVVQELLEED